jgi:hypothetical protein
MLCAAGLRACTACCSRAAARAQVFLLLCQTLCSQLDPLPLRFGFQLAIKGYGVLKQAHCFLLGMADRCWVAAAASTALACSRPSLWKEWLRSGWAPAGLQDSVLSTTTHSYCTLTRRRCWRKCTTLMLDELLRRTTMGSCTRQQSGQ